MAGHFRRIIASKLFQSFSQSGLLPKSQETNSVEKLASLVKVKKISKHHTLESGQFLVNSQHLNNFLKDNSDPNHKLAEQVKDCLFQDTSFKELGITFNGKFFNFTFEPTNITEVILSSVYNEGSKYGFTSHLHQTDNQTEKQTVVIEYSSPNIAKPFHVGHLRSTIIGNFFSNLYEQLGYNVIRLNYLGDWGTQFGLLAAGYHQYGCETKLLADPLHHLFQVYVKVNKDATQETDTKCVEDSQSLYNRSREIFQKMEKGEGKSLDLWKRFRDLSIKEYQKIYKRLGISFTEIHSESMYSESANQLLQHLRHTGLLQINEEEGRTEFIEIPDRNRNSKVTMCKSDGTTLYLTRDVAAALHRKKEYNFNKIHYVVDNRQKQHFQNLQAVLKTIGEDWVTSLGSDFHIGFGRIIGMNTRMGKVIFLKDLLDEAQHQMLSKRKETSSSKDVADEMAVADTLGISSILVQDLKERRNFDYTFSWKKCLNFKADSGVFLQYAHARLCSLKQNCAIPLTHSVDAALLKDPAALRLVLHISRYDEVILNSFLSFEPFHVVQYLFQLAHLSNQSLHSLVVKGQVQDIAQARLLLFHSAQQILSSGLRLIGVQPLQCM
ncbi:probable arginine--tRNA ligase, mitochondrial [Octopus bimaculoides]|uniref:probable arginine--tRNA ligase, mitochondrial n=1 Tax=Octopus bimaculoides TaxID=37653 RepID=UPI00071CAB15|nr:probable arginine--tRNA ligase, mitochondrial [Octopus bimaculoides]|eukprot:XP_014774268.1 PREDICTED: probable arginine--tRNA ligase, mitochondrial [Octopus bimaculoides]